MKPLTPSEIETIRAPRPTVDPFSLEELVSWLERQDGARAYCYGDAGRCLLAQWFKFCGKAEFMLGNVLVTFADDTDNTFRIPDSFQNTAMSRPHTFSAALDRARSARAVEQAKGGET